MVYVIGIPLHDAIPGVFFSPQVISPRDELQQHRSAALHSAAIAAAAATSAAAAASSVERSLAAAYDLPLAGLASVPTGLASCATAPPSPLPSITLRPSASLAPSVAPPCDVWLGDYSIHEGAPRNTIFKEFLEKRALFGVV